MEDGGSKLTPTGGEDEDAAVFDFLSDLLDDQSGAGARPLAVYLARYPGHEEAIASEYLRATGQVEPASAKGARSPGRRDRDGADRDAGQGEQDGDGRLIGHYRLDRELGAGGQGAVWLATDQDLGRQVALKLMTTPFVTEERRRRFRREAESIARLDHPSLAGVHDADVDAEPPWIAMRYVEGADLSRQLESARAALDAAPNIATKPGGPRSDGPGHLPLIPGTRAELARVLRFFERAARALHAAHEEGLVHRDIKPANLMVAPSGDPVVLDFGLARMAESEGVTPDPALTREGEVFGTPAYMAPEQLSGGAAESSPGVDVWALGVSLHEALTGQRPFQGEGPHDLGLAILGAPLPDPGERNPVVTSEVRVILATAMERDRARRYPSALAFAEDLRRIREFEPIQARPAGPWLRLRRWCRREPATAITVAALTVGIALVSVALKINGQLLDESNENLSLAEGRLRLATAQNYSSHLAGFQARSPAGALALALEAHELVDTWWTRSGVVAPLQETSLDLVLRVPTGRAWDADTLRTAEGEVLLAGSMEGFVSLFDLEAGEVLARRQLAIEGGAPGDLRGVEVLGDGGSALVTSTDGWLRRLALPDLADVFAVDPGVGPLVWMQVDEPRGRVFVLGRGGGIAQLDLSSGAVQRRMAVPEQSAAELVLVPDASGLGFPEGLLITGPRVRSGEGRVQAETLRVLAAAGGDLLATLDLTARVHLFCWTSGALYVADIEGRLVRIGLEADGAGGVTSTQEIIRGPGPVRIETLQPGPDGALLVGAGRGGGSWVIDAGGAEAALPEGSGGAVAAAWLGKDGLALAGSDGRIRVYGGAGGRWSVQRTHVQEAQDYRVLPLAGGRLLSFGVTSKLNLWRPRGIAECWRRPAPPGVSPASAVLAIGAEGAHRALVTSHAGGEVRRLELPNDGVPEWGAGAVLDRHGAAEDPALEDPAPLIAASKHGERFATTGVDQRLALRDADGALLGRVQGIHLGDPRALDVASSGELAAAVYQRGGVLVLTVDAAVDARDPRAGVRSGSLTVDGATVVAAGPAGRLLAVGDDQGQVHVFEAVAAPEGPSLKVSLRPLWSGGPEPGDRQPGRGAAAVTDLTFSPDGTRLLASSRERWIDEWAAASGDPAGPGRQVLGQRWVRYLPGGRRVAAIGRSWSTVRVDPAPSVGDQGEARVFPSMRHDDSHSSMDVMGGEVPLVVTASLDGSVLVWAADDGELRARFGAHDGPVVDIDTGFAGSVVSVSQDGTTALWPVNGTEPALRTRPRQLLAMERQRLERAAGGR